MNLNALSPYVRVAMRSEMTAPFCIRDRVIFDYEIIYLQSGAWRLTYEGKETICQAGDLLLICPGRLHRIDCLPGVPVSQPHIHFDLFYDENSEKIPVSFKPMKDLTPEERTWIRKDYFGDAMSSPILKLKNAKEVADILLETVDNFREKPPMYQVMCKANLLRLIYLLLPALPKGSLNEPAAPESRLAMVKAYIDQNFAGELSLSLLARQFTMDKFTLAKRFASEFGIPIIAYWHKVRLKKAQAMLLRGAGVSETATALGFSSVYTFSRFFKNKTGIAPSNYAKTIRAR
ncbi:MAG TPA: AraC family transcriptional regulator [Clostridiales bacterium]|nr:AraC family transcriptional regulator [Clostridiales bacterium]